LIETVTAYIVQFAIAFQGFAFGYFLLINSLYTLFIFISFREVRKHVTTFTSHSVKTIITGVNYRPLSIILPAYNEEKVIIDSVKALMSLRYPEFEVIVVNDGSVDGTLEALKNEFRLIETNMPVRLSVGHKPVRGVYISYDYQNLIVVDKENGGGKFDANNAGVNVARYPLFCVMDADSLLDSEALIRATRLFVDDRSVVASGGIVRLLNGAVVKDGKVAELHAPKKFIERFQAIEYTRGFLSGRTAWNYFNSLMIISGAFGIFRKDMVIETGGYRKCIGEDMDLVVRLHKYCKEKKIPYKILFASDPVCYTQVPSEWKSLLKQRSRWHKGLLDSLVSSRKMFLNPRYGWVGLFGMPYFALFEAVGPSIEFLGYASFTALWFADKLAPWYALLFFIVAVLANMGVNLGSVLIDNLLVSRYRNVRDVIILSVFAVVEMIGYRQLVTLWRMTATLSFPFNRMGTWGTIKRYDLENKRDGGAGKNT